MVRRLLYVGLLLVSAGCDSSDFSVLDNQVVVELTLVANEPVPPARVSFLAQTDQEYEFEDLAIRDAEVILTTGSTELRMESSPDTPGIYSYLGAEHIVQPSAQYDLLVNVPQATSPITGSTNVPTSVEILSASRESGTYESTEQLVLIVSPGKSTDQSQSKFTLVTKAIDAVLDTAVPTVVDFLEDDDELTIEDFRISGSPIITEGNFVKFPDGTIELIYPWIGVSFFGPNIIYVNSLDENMSDFIRSAELQQGGGTFGPGVVPNAIQTLSGAHGLFGSVSRDSVRFIVFLPSGE